MNYILKYKKSLTAIALAVLLVGGGLVTPVLSQSTSQDVSSLQDKLVKLLQAQIAVLLERVEELRSQQGMREVLEVNEKTLRFAIVPNVRNFYKPGSEISIRNILIKELENIESYSSTATYSEGFRVEAEIWAPRGDHLPSSSANARFNDNHEWEVDIDVPDRLGKYTLVLKVYCADEGSECARRHDIYDFADESTYATIDKDFTVVEADEMPKIIVTSPSDSKVYKEGDVVNIRYSVDNFPQSPKVYIDLNKLAPGSSREPYTSVHSIADGIFVSGGRYNWKIPNDIESGDDYTISVSAWYPSSEVKYKDWSREFTIDMGSNSNYHPADVNKDYRITQSELTGYASKVGGQTTMVNIASNIWRNGETYSYDSRSNSFKSTKQSKIDDLLERMKEIKESNPSQSYRAHHHADSNEDWQISLNELQRVVAMKNAGGYHCQDGEDSYALGRDINDHNCPPHDSDYDPQDWQISTSEIERLRDLYESNYYKIDSSGEDGFSPSDENPHNNSIGLSENSQLANVYQSFGNILTKLRNMIAE